MAVLFDYLFKTIIVGSPGVGKTSITLRFATGTFRERYLPTIGVEFSVKDIEVQGKQVKLQTWDTGSHDRFSYVRPLYYKGSYGVLVVFDIASKESFENLDKWFEEVYSNCEEIIPAILIGNKADIEADRQVSKEDALDYAEKKRAFYELHEIPYFEVSAKSGQNINDIYYRLTDMMIEKSIEAEN
ncbi:MAG: GTP-binding protein [Candidatus Heimdallarchaeota archaeon]|nr:GTP-binding protein [Candidatus Heimdallarchaeota archaeon]MCG3254771.1 GTP-binding protein [Candidatus Heimdallarchaeota archaeon]MCK4609850.1 GTP-binding protein [Candidatus Heimdallarchaeota archaeon]